MSRSILAPFDKFSAEGAAVGRLLAGYSGIEIDLLHCVQMARGGDFDTVLKQMFRFRGETRRIDEAQKLSQGNYQHLDLTEEFREAIAVVRYCLKIRNQYAHWVWWDDSSGKLAFANPEDLARCEAPVNDFLNLKPNHVDVTLLTQQESYFIYASELLNWVNYEGRFRDGRLNSGNPLSKPQATLRPKLHL